MTTLSTTLDAGADVRKGLVSPVSSIYPQTSNSQLACTIQYQCHIDPRDIIALVCQSGPRQGEIGAVDSYLGQRMNVVFEDKRIESFSGPSLNELKRPSLNDYGVELFYIGDLLIDRGIHSSSDSSGKIRELMNGIGRTYSGLTRFCRELKIHPVEYCARRVNRIIKEARTLQNEGLWAK